jgi:hypothetical protein
VRHFVRILVVSEAFDLFRSICDEQFPASSSYVTPTMAFVDFQPLGVLAEPEKVAPGFFKK